MTTDLLSDLRCAETQLAEARMLLARCVEFARAAEMYDLTAYENVEGEIVFVGDLIADVEAVL